MRYKICIYSHLDRCRLVLLPVDTIRLHAVDLWLILRDAHEDRVLSSRTGLNDLLPANGRVVNVRRDVDIINGALAGLVVA